MWQDSFKNELIKIAWIPPSRVKLLEGALKSRVLDYSSVRQMYLDHMAYARKRGNVKLLREAAIKLRKTEELIAKGPIGSTMGAAKEVIKHIQRGLGGGSLSEPFRTYDTIITRDAGKRLYRDFQDKFVTGKFETFIRRPSDDVWLQPLQRKVKK